MDNKEKLYAFLNAHEFLLVQEDTSEFFGDHYEIFSKDNIQIRFSSSKSFESIDIQNSFLSEDWYDLALIKNLLKNEKDLIGVITIEEQKDFLEKEFKKIIEMFNDSNFSGTKKKLEKLGNERANQMFPGISRVSL